MIVKSFLLIATLCISFSTSLFDKDKIIIENFNNESIAPKNNQILGSSRVHLDGNCGNSECNLGNFIADSFVDWNAQRFESEYAWTDAALAMIKADAIKASFTKEENEITQENIDSCLAGEKIVIVEISGAVLKSALEHSISRYEKDKSFDEFLQFSGINVEYNVSRSSGDRVINIEVLCANCTIPKLEKLEITQNYRILMQESLPKDTKGYSMFADKIIKTIETTDREMFAEFLMKKSPIYPAVEWRITVHGAASTTVISMILIILSLLLSMIQNF